MCAVYIFIEETLLHTCREKIKKNFFKLRRVDGSAVCRKAHKETGINSLVCNFTGRSGNYFLTAVAYRNQTTFSGAFRPKGILVYLLFKSPGKVV